MIQVEGMLKSDGRGATRGCGCRPSSRARFSEPSRKTDALGFAEVDQTLVAFWTLPALRQPVHTETRRMVPGEITARTRWMLGFQRRLVRRWEWLTLMPNDGFLPHTSQVDAITALQDLR